MVFRASGISSDIRIVDSATVPIVKMIDNDTKMFLDISFNTAQGLKAAEYINEMRKLYPLLEPLVYVLKQFLVERSLNQVFFSETLIFVLYFLVDSRGFLKGSVSS